MNEKSKNGYASHWFKANKKSLVICLVITVLVVAVALIAFASSDKLTADDIILKTFDAPVNLSNNDRGGEQPLELSYSLKNEKSAQYVKNAVFEISENEGFTAVKTVIPENNKAEIFGLIPRKTYFYGIKLTLTDGNVIQKRAKVTLDCYPRILNVDGVNNIRDIGGYKTESGYVRYGMLYRGSEIDGAVEPSFVITEKGKAVMSEELNIKSDMDLRQSVVNPDSKSEISDAVSHEFYSFPMYEECFSENGKKAVLNLFKDLAQTESYPVYLHCTYGCDRTGTACLLLEAMLGVSETDIIRDYELSSLSFPQINKAALEKTIEKLKNEYDGDSLQQKTVNFLRSCGIKDEEITTIQNQFTTQK